MQRIRQFSHSVKRQCPKFLLFVSSYAPLFLMLGIRIEVWAWTISFIVLAVASIAVLFATLKVNARIAPIRYRVVEAREAGPEAASYLAAYLLPLVMVANPGTRDWLIVSVFIVTAAFIYMRSSIVQINPVLYVLGYQVLAVTSEEGFHGYLLTNEKTRPGTTIAASRMGDDVLIFRRLIPA